MRLYWIPITSHTAGELSTPNKTFMQYSVMSVLLAFRGIDTGSIPNKVYNIIIVIYYIIIMM